MLGAEGYVFELERRGCIKAGPYVPEVVLDYPDAVRELHREFLIALEVIQNLGLPAMVTLAPTWRSSRCRPAIRRRARWVACWV